MASVRIPRWLVLACGLPVLLAAAVVCVPLLGADAPPARGNTSGSKDAGDEAAIREVVRKYMDAREAQDPKAIEPLFTADADQLVSDGAWREGGGGAGGGEVGGAP